ncbi:unnamed protein product [Bemisia tabaci]|uniref:ABC transporter domain-containing protein n=1 Tax=Bemisia tabaci TaxID=7038 RepID=A0A9P0A818_BEMTA|nr:unnamed protein product [Bemisia tabaci]
MENGGFVGEICADETDSTAQAAVAVRNAYKRYTPTAVILKNLNMTVKQSTVYGLLGPSGCGKTTLLSCIVGRIHLDSGSVNLRIRQKSKLGYMPQTLQLYVQLTIYENLAYYGYVFGMDKKAIQEKADELCTFLQLPPQHKLVSNISGGQQRRVSFAVALLHDPELLILDEPTVGLDPVLANNIWERLLEMTKHGKTIIITTHYIEEAKNAHQIGLMRGGVLLAEESPSSLMANYNCSSLEEVFLKLSYKQETQQSQPQPIEEFTIAEKPPPLPLEDTSVFRFTRFYATFMKLLYLSRRELRFVAFLICLPLAQSVFFNLAIGTDPTDLKIGIVDDELSHGLRECRMSRNNHCAYNYTEDLKLSCLYLDELEKKNFKLIEFDDIVSGKKAIKSSDQTWALIHFPRNYSEALSQRVNDGHDASGEALFHSSVDVWVDLSNQYIGNMVRRDIYYATQNFLQSIFMVCGDSPRLGSLPIVFNEPIHDIGTPGFIHFASVAFIILSSFYFPLISSEALILNDKMEGIIERSVVAGMKFAEIAVADSLFLGVVYILQMIITMVVLYGVFHNPFKGDVAISLAILFLAGVQGIFFGILIALNSNTYTEGAYLGIGSNLVLTFISGLVWPIESHHFLLKLVSPYFPLVLPTEGLRAVTAKEWGIDHPVVIKGFQSSFIWCSIFIIGVFLTLKFKKNALIIYK